MIIIPFWRINLNYTTWFEYYLNDKNDSFDKSLKCFLGFVNVDIPSMTLLFYNREFWIASPCRVNIEIVFDDKIFQA